MQSLTLGGLVSPYYHKGTAICSAFVFFVAILAVVLRL